MRENIIKKSDSKLEKKKAKLQKLLSTKNQIEHKIKLLKADIEVLQTQQFEKLKKAAKKENLEIRSDDIPEILQLIKNLQQNSKTDSDNPVDETVTEFSERISETKLSNRDSEPAQRSGLRTLAALQSIESFHEY